MADCINGSPHPRYCRSEWALRSSLPAAAYPLSHLGGSRPLHSVIYGSCTFSFLLGLAEPHVGVEAPFVHSLSKEAEGATLVSRRASQAWRTVVSATVLSIRCV